MTVIAKIVFTSKPIPRFTNVILSMNKNCSQGKKF
jgi:hypothetical protein